MRVLLTILLLLIISRGWSATGSNYYFSTTDGDDSRTTSQAHDPSTPWKTISKLNSFFPNLIPGDRVFFKRGDVFPGTLTLNKSGTSTAPITIGDYGVGALPEMTGFTTVTSWTSNGNGIWESNVLSMTSATLNMVTINGQLYAMGRYPNEGASNGGYLTFESSGTGYIRDGQLSSTSLNSSWNGAMLQIRTTHSSFDRGKLSNISGDTLKYTGSYTGTAPAGYGYFVQNTIKALDQYGEWYFDPSTNKLSVYFGAAGPGTAVVKAASQDILWTIHGSYITLKNLFISGANSAILYGDWAGITDLTLQDCRIAYGGIDGMRFFNLINLLVDGCTIENINVDGINLPYRDSFALVRNTLLQNITMHAGMIQRDQNNQCGAAIISTQYLTAINDSVTNCGYEGIRADGDGILIKNNYIEYTCRVLDDGGGIYTWVGAGNATRSNRIIRGNIVRNIGFGSQYGTSASPSRGYVSGGGIYFDDNANNVTCDSNSVSDCNMDGLFAHNARNIAILHNVFYNNTIQAEFQHDANGSATRGLNIQHNQFFSTLSSQVVLSLRSSNNDVDSLGIINNNSYCRPLSESAIIVNTWFGHADVPYSLGTWKTNHPVYDNNSTGTPVSVASLSDIYYSYSLSPALLTLDGTYVTPDNITYNTGSLALSSYSSAILIKTSSSIVSPGGTLILYGKKLIF